MTMNDGVVRSIRSISLTVPDLAAAKTFYREAFGCVELAAPERLGAPESEIYGAAGAVVTRVSLRLGTQRLDLLAFDPPGQAYPPASTSSDAWFQHCAIVVTDMATACDHLRGFGIAPISEAGAEILPPNTGSVAAFKFRDPFGHPLELLQVPPGIGDPIWQGGAGRSPFMGIDHTAIVVAYAARSTRFYERLLGFEVAARSHNRGPEQSRLDAVDSDSVDVVALKPRRAPPHLELLGYQAGRRRLMPAAWGGADIVATRTSMEVNGLEVLRRRLEQAGHTISVDGRGRVALQDPDGHRLVLYDA